MEENNKTPNKDRFEITELIMAQAGWHRTFVGTIKRLKDEMGNEISVHGKLMVKKCHVWSKAQNYDQLGDYFDSAAFLILDFELSDYQGVWSEIAKASFSHN